MRVLYVISDIGAFVLQKVLRYRTDVVMDNLTQAFPEKTLSEKKQIANKFYHNFCDTFMEMIKLFSWNKEEIKKRLR